MASNLTAQVCKHSPEVTRQWNGDLVENHVDGREISGT